MYRILLFITLFSYSGKAQLLFTEQFTDLDKIAEASEIKGDVIIKNNSEKKIFLLRADAESGIKIYASKKTLLPNDTTLLVISFIPKVNGKFKKKISLVSSVSEKPHLLELSGDILKVVVDDKQACFYFGSRRNSNVKIKEGAIVVKESNEPRDNSNKIPDNSTPPTALPDSLKLKKPLINQNENTELSVLEYKPNNILFLVDVSGSMKDSLKLPLMKNAIYTLIDAVRNVDRITLVTYSDSAKVLCEGVAGDNKELLKKMVKALKTKGYTKGNKAILKSQELAQQHYIEGGNNQIILATDGIFIFHSENQKKWRERQKDKKIILSTVAFGDDKTALKNLKDISKIGEGSFIHIKNRGGSKEQLLNEIKMRSKR